jgi:hypothetical protein
MRSASPLSGRTSSSVAARLPPPRATGDFFTPRANPASGWPASRRLICHHHHLPPSGTPSNNHSRHHHCCTDTIILLLHLHRHHHDRRRNRTAASDEERASTQTRPGEASAEEYDTLLRLEPRRGGESCRRCRRKKKNMQKHDDVIEGEHWR